MGLYYYSVARAKVRVATRCHTRERERKKKKSAAKRELLRERRQPIKRVVHGEENKKERV